MTKYLLPILLVFFWSCEADKEDNTPPIVTITYPQNGSTVYEIVSITCISSDNEGVEKVELWVNGVTTGLTDNSEPYSFDWNTTLVDNGNYTITIRSYDTSDNTTDSEPIVLTVDNTQSNPQPINITSVVFDNGGFTITWDESTDGDFSSYELEKSTDSTMDSPSVVFTTESLEQTTYFDTDVNPLIYQFYRVTVIDTFDYETKGQIVSSSLDPVPSSVNVESVEYTLEEMTISWSESSDDDFKHYDLLYSVSESGEKTSVTTITNKSTTSHSITEFNPNNENWYWVEVSDTLGQTSIGTGMTNSLNNEPTPVNVTSVTYDLESMTITWEEYVPNLSRINQMNQNTRSTVTNDFVSYELLQSVGGGLYTSVIVITNEFTTSHLLTEYDPTQENWFKVKVTDYWGLNSTGNGMTNLIDSVPTPVNVTSVTYDLESMIIIWEQTSDNDFVSYELLQSDSEDGIYTSVIVITNEFTSSHYLTEYDPTMENWFKVKVTDFWGLNSTGSSMTNVIDSPPTQIDFLSVYYGSESINISWENSSDDDFSSYQLLYSETYNGEQTSITTISDINNTSYTFTGFNSLEDRWYWIKVSDYWNLETIGNGYNFEITPLAFSEDCNNPNENWILNEYFSFQGGVLIHNGVDDGLGHHAILYYSYISNDGDMLATPFELAADVKWISGTGSYRAIGFSDSMGKRYYFSISGSYFGFKSWQSTEGWNDIISWTVNQNITSEGRLKILCLESTISFYFDDHLLGSYQFDMGSQLPVNLRMYSQGDAVVEFDNIKLYGDFIDSNNRQLISNEGDRVSILTREEKDLNMPENDHNPELMERFSNDSLKE